jgi:predicted dehydrogenase
VTEHGRIRAAIVGAGLMGRWHARAVEQARGSVVAVIDPNAALAERLASRHGARAVATLSEIATRARIDVAHICTPLGTHAVLAREAIGLGMHALVEKPLAHTAGETEDLLRHAAANGRLIWPVHQFPFQRGVRDVVAALPRIAPILHVLAVACSAGAEGGTAELRDRVAVDILPHPLSLFAALLDRPIADASWEARRTRPGELLAIGVAGGVTLSLTVSMAGRPTTNGLRVIGAMGTAHADLFHGFAVIEAGGVSRARKIVHPFAYAGATLARGFGNLTRRAITGESAYPGLRELVAAFYAAIRGQANPPLAARQILDVALARDTIIRAAMPC